MPPPARVPPAKPGEDKGAEGSHIVNLPPGHVYSHTAVPSTHFFNPDEYAQDSQHDTDYKPDMLTDERVSTG